MSLCAPELHASTDVREPISLHQVVLCQTWSSKQAVVVPLLMFSRTEKVRYVFEHFYSDSICQDNSRFSAHPKGSRTRTCTGTQTIWQFDTLYLKKYQNSSIQVRSACSMIGHRGTFTSMRLSAHPPNWQKLGIRSPWWFEHSGMAHGAVMIAHCPASVECPCIAHVLSVHPAAWLALYWSTIRLSAETVS